MQPECSYSLWSFNGLLGLGVLLPNSLWHAAVLAMLPIQKIFRIIEGEKKAQKSYFMHGTNGMVFSK